MKKYLAAVLLSLATIAVSIAAEPTGPGAIDAWRKRVNTAAMITLGSWALANIGTGTVLSFTIEGSAGLLPVPGPAQELAGCSGIGLTCRFGQRGR